MRIFREALRQLRALRHAELLLAEEKAEQEAFHWQVSRLAALEPALDDYLTEAAPDLAVSLAKADAGPSSATSCWP